MILRGENVNAPAMYCRGVCGLVGGTDAEVSYLAYFPEICGVVPSKP